MIMIMTMIALLLACVLVYTIVYFIKREQRFADQIQTMLDHAIAGKFQDQHLNESNMSAIENNMWRYLCDNEIDNQHLAEEKEQMQKHISDISHQAVIPIANIVLYSQLLEEWLDLQNVEGKQEIKDQIEAIQEQAETLDFLIESLVKLSRLETGIVNVNSRRQPLQPVLDAVRNQFQAKASQKDIRLVLQDTDEYAVFDMKWTIEAVANIVDNAIKYTPFGGNVSIGVEAYSSLVRLDVVDTGIGISEAEQANVFTRFYRSETVNEKPGVGIGLYLAREVMKAQDGYIKLISKTGEGSRFSLFFMKDEISQN